MMSEQDFINLERQFRDRQNRTELAFKACAELAKHTVPGDHPLYPAINLARRALGIDEGS